ncbi:concanavalin A-like lectin/glucanase [Dothidotthia symphoricarpi CBS 119687]|uniref:Concanavalin A-like lectin/glucanase n=1 Tax=Dothidotthia symphoricarpi CBS 119687 TaxID=1392245 RepID=A0A6A6AT36_9PLEO|nr:concanavalin A-like lectin/glucanase [Dothidotthia symphoricarpi CBS 119687]KAF2134830.1 concanavalin A-like lectin/glucanase [Dothidotthia symphoricarpi CBS 119687]
MYLTAQTLRTAAWSSLALSVARAQYTIDTLSFGNKDGVYISPDMRHIPHWNVQGKDEFAPQVLSDRVILTPPYPGGKRGSLWAEDALHHSGDWTAELDFRATGMERGGGNLQLWYVKESQAQQTPNSLYTAPKFDGLVLVIDQYEGHGGSVRGFLNDGTIDLKSHQDPDTLAFGKCDYAYRNRGVLSTVKLHHAEGFLEVTIDGASCFKTDKVKLPDNYFFGISASSAENPDSFEVHKFIVSTTNSHTREEPNRQRYPPPDNRPKQNIQEQRDAQAQQQTRSSGSQANIPQMLQDVLASNIKSQEDQFADLHNRVQSMSHRVDALFDLLEKSNQENAKRWDEMLRRQAPMDDRSGAAIRNMEKIDRTTMQILRDLESKDFKDALSQVHRSIENSHQGLTASMPLAMASIAAGHKPSMTAFLFIAIAVQIMVTGAYIVYKKRRNGAPKKYL